MMKPFKCYVFLLSAVDYSHLYFIKMNAALNFTTKVLNVKNGIKQVREIEHNVNFLYISFPGTLNIPV